MNDKKGNGFISLEEAMQVGEMARCERGLAREVAGGAQEKLGM